MNNDNINTNNNVNSNNNVSLNNEVSNITNNLNYESNNINNNINTQTINPNNNMENNTNNESKKNNTKWIIIGIIVIILIGLIILFVVNKTDKSSSYDKIIDTEKTSETDDNKKLLFIDRYDFSKLKEFDRNIQINNIDVPLTYEDVARVSNYSDVTIYGIEREETTWDDALNSTENTKSGGKNSIWFDIRDKDNYPHWTNINLFAPGTYGEALKNNQFLIEIYYTDLIGNVEISKDKTYREDILIKVLEKLGKPTHIWHYPGFLPEYGMGTYDFIYDGGDYTLWIHVLDYPEWDSIHQLNFYYAGVNYQELLDGYYDISNTYILYSFDELLNSRRK